MKMVHLFNTIVAAFVATTSLILPKEVNAFNLPQRSISVRVGLLVGPRSSKTALSVVSIDATSSNERKYVSFENFDYLAHWYPVSWARDVPYDQPTKVTVFDVDYVIAKLSASTDEVICMVDQCPHKSAALSEGRITSSAAGGKQFIQCAYHGWSFDGTTGDCVEIPQATTGGKHKVSPRFCGKAVPAMMHQGLVWIFPGGTLEQALAAPPPPSVPEIDMPGWKLTEAVRDFPVDWSILVSNIMDPDHGLFAHQAKPFDLYTASKQSPITLTEEITHDGKGWTVTAQVDAKEKLLELDQSKRPTKKKKKKQKKDDEKAKLRISTTRYHAPSVIWMGRMDPETHDYMFKTCFWVCPTGTGRSRFMSAGVGKLPFRAPRWIQHVFLNRFLDQDTYLLATQHKYVLGAEAADVKELLSKQEQKQQQDNLKVESSTTILETSSPKEKEEIEAKEEEETTAATEEILPDNSTTTTFVEPVTSTVASSVKDSHSSSSSSSSSNEPKKTTHHHTPTHTRRKLFRFGSPSDKLVSRIDTFWDETLTRVPNRITTLLALDRTTGNFMLPSTTPTREIVLDRNVQHLQICPESQQTVQRLVKIRNWSLTTIISLVCFKLWMATTNEATMKIWFMDSSITTSSHNIYTWMRKLNSWLGPNRTATLVVLGSLVAWITNKIRGEFYFKYTKERHNQDLQTIPNVWLDPTGGTVE